MYIMATFRGKLMTVMSAKEARNNFGKMMEDVQREPIVITKHSRASAVLISAEDYRQMKLEKLRASLAIGEQQAKNGDFADFSLEQIIVELDSGD